MFEAISSYEIILFFFLIAILYSSVGFGGGSSYLAILALYSFEYQMIRLCALLCNVVVVSTGCYIFYREGHFNFRKMLPLVLISVPLAFLGGRLRMEENTFFVLLGLTLLLAGILLLFTSGKNPNPLKSKNSNPAINGTLGGGIGFLSGMVGIGGGIFLSPVLNLMRWDKAKTIAATASLYILVNSISGILGQLSRGIPMLNWTLIIILVIAVFIGGQIGSRLGAKRFSQLAVRRATAALVLFVAVRILYKYMLV